MFGIKSHLSESGLLALKKELYNEKNSPYNLTMRYVILLLTCVLAGCGDAPRTPLGKAAAHGTEAEVKALLRGAAPDQVQSALVSAARFGNKVAVPIIVAAGADPNHPAGVNSWPPLMHAIHKNQIAGAEALIDAGAKVNHTQSDGGTPLMMAAGYGYVDIVQMLLQKGADPGIRNASGETALDFAVTGVSDVDRFTYGSCQPDTVKTLLVRTPDPAVVTRAIRKAGTCSDVRAILENAVEKR
jgi:hypothetical protein